MQVVESKKNINNIIEKLAEKNRFSNSTIFYGPNLKNIFSLMINLSNKIHQSSLELQEFSDDDIFEPEVDKIIINPPGQSIKINLIHQLQQRIQYGSHSSKTCIIMIHEFERLTTNATNALLKTIEDPPENTIFLLSCINKETIIPTIKSRSQAFFIPNESINISKNNEDRLEEIATELTYITPQDYLKLSQFKQCNYVQNLPKSSDQIQKLLTCWTTDLFENFLLLSNKEKNFLEKVIEIISKLNYNLNLKLQLLAITFETKED